MTSTTDQQNTDDSVSIDADCSTAFWLNDFENKWEALSREQKMQFIERIQIPGFAIVKRTFVRRLFIAPIVLWKHYRLTRRQGGGVWIATQFAFVWTAMLLFPEKCRW